MFLLQAVQLRHRGGLRYGLLLPQVSFVHLDLSALGFDLLFLNRKLGLLKLHLSAQSLFFVLVLLVLENFHLSRQGHLLLQLLLSLELLLKSKFVLGLAHFKLVLPLAFVCQKLFSESFGLSQLLGPQFLKLAAVVPNVFFVGVEQIL